MKTPARRRLAAAALVLLAPTLGACGFNYQTDQVYQAGIGSDARDGTVEVLGAVIVSSSDGSGTFVASLVNSNVEQDDKLTDVASSGAEAKLSAPIDLKADSLVNLADQGAVSVTGDRVSEGNFIRVELTFDSGQKTSLNVPVVAKSDQWDDVKSAPSGDSTSPSSSPSASPSP